MEKDDQIVIKLLPVIVTTIGLVVNVWLFTRQQAVNDRMEFKRRIWEKRMGAYSELGDVVATLVTTYDTTEFKMQAINFDRHYWGKLPLFEDDSLEIAMKSFRNQVEDQKQGLVDEYDPGKLKKAGFPLIKTCQYSLHKSWNETQRNQ